MLSRGVAARPSTPDSLTGGEMGALIRAHDWSTTPLGPIGAWPQSLKTMVAFILRSPLAMVLLWGEDGVMLYNEGYAAIVGERHPGLLGAKVREAWPDLSDFDDDIMRIVLAGGTLSYRDQELILHRNGQAEQVFMDLDYSPVLDESGKPAGVIAIVAETTERIRAERRNASERERHARMFEQAPGFITILNGPDHVFEFVNNAYRRLFGDRDFVGRTAREVFPDLAGQNFFELLDQVYSTSERFVAQHVPIQLGRSPGDPPDKRVLDFIYEPITDEEGRVTGIFCEGHDVTDAQRAGAELHESEARYRTLFAAAERKAAELHAVLESMPDAVYIGGEKGITLANQPALDQLGFATREDLNRHIGTLAQEIQTRDAETGAPIALEDQAFTRAFRGERVVQDVRVRHRLTGEERVVRCAAAPVMIDSQVIAAVAVNTDITDARRAEEDLRRSEERYRTLFESIDAGFCIIEVKFDEANRPIDYRFVEVNLAFERQTGLVDAAGKWMRELAPAHEQHWFDMYGRIALTGEPVRFENAALALGRWYDVHAFRIGAPEARRVAILFNDLSDRRRAEEALRELNETLEQRVAERTAELEQAHEQLRQSQKLEAMGQLTGGVAHDFNNLLMPIIGGLDILQRRASDERSRRLIDGALQSADRAKTLVQRLLAFARRQPLQPTAIDLPQLIGGMAELIASTSGPRVKVMVDVKEDLPQVKTDPNQLEMAILNLAVNARDAMPDGGQLTIAAAEETLGFRHRSKLTPGRYVRLSVSDTGIGMDEATLARAIEPFFSTKGIGKGTGLGLSMVHGLAAQLGGALTIQSKLGVGTSVELWLPIAAETGLQLEPAEGEVSLAAAGTALLVDDEGIVRTSTADMLSDLGYAVVETASAEEALALINSGLAPNVLITDHLMPGMTGNDLAQVLKERRPTLPVLIISGYAEDEGIAPDLPRLTKPFRQGELAASLSKLTTVAGNP
jgi:PAS domain S-box-containing protein